MKNLLILLVLVALGAAAYKMFSSSDSELSQLEYVPADTAIFSAQIDPIDMQSYMASLGVFPAQIEQFKDVLMQEGMQGNDPVSLFFMQIMQDYLDGMANPAEYSKMTGLKNELRSMIYMVGISPVMQVELDNAENFLALFARAQATSGISHSEKTIDGVAYQSYLLTDDGDMELLVRVNEMWGVVTLHSPKFDDVHLSTSLAITKPANNLLDSDVFDKIRGEYNFTSNNLGFISSQQIGLAFTSIDGNSLATDLNIVAGEEAARELAEIRTPECKADIDMLTGMWPGIFMSSNVKQVEGAFSMGGTMLIPTTSQTAIDGLKSLRGFLPSYTTDGLSSSFFNMGVGTDVANLSRSVNSMFTAMTSLELSCAPIVAMQQEMKQNNPTGAFAMAGVANGFLGMAAAFNNLDVSRMQEGIIDIDALISLSAEDVRTLYSSVQTFAPMLGAITLPADGDELIVNEVFPMLDQFGVTVSAMATDGQLVLFSGDKAREQATQTLSEAPVKNGLIAFGMDYKKFMDQLMPVIAMSGQPMPPELEAMMGVDMEMTMTMDVNDAGIVMTSDVTMKN